MELKNEYMIYIGVLVLLLVIFVRRRQKDGYKGGKKIFSMSYIENEPYFKRKMFTYRILCTLLITSCIVAMAVSFFLMARPYKKVVTEKEVYSRDIILCLDISYSVDELNLELVENLKDTVSNLKGERFGIVIFNASAVLLSPLTDDYDYIIDTLDQLKESISYRISADNFDGSYDIGDDNWLYLNNYIIDGTLVGADERGSSLIGDGLATSVYDFPDLDEEERTRIIIFSTDNDLEGTPIVTLNQAADICKKNDVVVFGIGTTQMYDENKAEMESAVAKTGGTFYLQEESGTVQHIVDEIEKKGKHLVKGKTEIKEVETMEVPAMILFCSVFFMMLLMKLTKTSTR